MLQTCCVGKHYKNVLCRAGLMHMDSGSGWKTCSATCMGHSGSRKVSLLSAC